MNLAHEEKVLIKDIFNVRVCVEAGDSESVILLKNFPLEIGALGPNISLMKNTTYFDSLLMERLQIPNTDVLTYLEECMNKCFYVIEKPWNQTQLAQEFIKYSIEIIKNFIYLSQLEPDLFPEQIQIDPDSAKVSDQTVAVAMRVMTHFEYRGFNHEILNIFHPKINEDTGGDFAEAFIEVLIARVRFQTIIDSKAYFYLTTFESLMAIPDFKVVFMKLPKTPFLPADISKIQGALIDRQSPLGLFLRPSILGFLPGYFHQEVEANKRFQEKTVMQFGKQKFGREKIKYYTDLQNEYYSKFTDIFKLFLRKDTQKKFLQWNYSLIIGNLSRTKLGSRLQNAKNSNLSHDGFMVNIYMCLLNLCKPIFNLQTEKYKNIDPEYFSANSRVRLCKYEKINKKDLPMVQYKQKQFGTITEFFFLSWELLNTGIIPTHENFVELMNNKQKLQKALNIPNHPLKHLIPQQLQKIRTKTVLYYLILMDDNMINPTIKLFDLLLILIPRWLNFDYDDLIDCKFHHKYKVPEIVQHLPEHLLDSIEKFHMGVYRYKQNYLQQLGTDHVHELLKLTCLILSEEGIVSNPYIGASYVELIFFLLYENKTGIMYEVFKTNTVAHRNLTLALMKFYCDIAVTGSAHQFYSKFRYRQCVNRIFMSLWVHDVYRDNLKSYFKSDVFEKFLNMIMGDTTYCFDETNEKYASFQELEHKRERGKLSEEEERNQEHLASQIQATLQQSASNLKLLKQLSKWSPETFFNEAFLGDIVRLSNNILQTFMDPTSFIANRQLLAKFKFEKEHVLSHLVQMYVNLDISERFASEIVKDTRFFKKEHFYKALQKASNEHQTDISILEKFQQLIGKLINPVNDEEDEQIYGEIPDKYLCNLMSTLMKEPVELPSGYVVDRIYIHKHILNDERDPFTRAPMKNGEWKEMKDLKAEIEIWKKKRLEELKGANKEVKYGKIGQNKKQEEGDSLYTGDKVIDYEDEEQEEK